MDFFQESAKSKIHPFRKNERKILKFFILGCMHQLFNEKINLTQDQILLEFYSMEKNVIQFVLREIVETEEYTLEGIAHSTRVPLDIIYDAACGINKQLSISAWSKIMDLYLQVRPDVKEVLIKRFVELNEKNRAAVSLLLCE